MRVLKCVAPALAIVGLSLPVLLAAPAAEPAGGDPVKEVMLAIHGGEGDLEEAELKPKEKTEYEDTMKKALTKGLAAMQARGGTGLDGVEAAIRVLEDSGLFDAGKGSVLDHDGHASLDASIMEGKDRKAGAVAGVTIVKNPISAARAVMDCSRHVLLVGRGADLFAIQQKLGIVHPDYFLNDKNWKDLQDAWKKEKDNPRFRKQASDERPARRRQFGTVGAVARWKNADGEYTLAAGTSTGGLTNKLPGRVGDSPIIGAGTYADDRACAVSATGIGEFFIRYAIAHDIAARTTYKEIPAAQAAGQAIDQLKTLQPPEPTPGGVHGVEGGVIVLDREGNFTTRYNSTQMTRGYIKIDGVPHVKLFEEKK